MVGGWVSVAWNWCKLKVAALRQAHWQIPRIEKQCSWKYWTNYVKCRNDFLVLGSYIFCPSVLLLVFVVVVPLTCSTPFAKSCLGRSEISPVSVCQRWSLQFFFFFLYFIFEKVVRWFYADEIRRWWEISEEVSEWLWRILCPCKYLTVHCQK